MATSVCKPTIIKTVLRDGVRRTIGSKQARKYTKAEVVNHDIIYDFLSTLAETTSRNNQKMRMNVAVNSDKSTVEVVEIEPIQFKDSPPYFSEERFNLLVEHYVDRKRQHAKRLKDNILSDYNKAFATEDNESPFQSFEDISLELIGENGVGKYTQEQIAKKFAQAGLPFILDYHYVIAKTTFIDDQGNEVTRNFPQLKPEIVKYVSDNYSEDPDTQTVLSEKQKESVIRSIREQREEIKRKEWLNDRDFNLYYSLAKMSVDGVSNLDFKSSAGQESITISINAAEKQAIRKKLNSSDKKTLDALVALGAYDENTDEINDGIVVVNPENIIDAVIDEFLANWINASEEYHTATIGSILFFKGKGESKQYIERGKRGALLSSTIHPYDTSNPFGIPRYGQLVIVEDPNQTFNTLIKDMGLDIADGASFSTEVQQIQFKNSLGNQIGQPTGSHIKDLGVFRDNQRETVTFKKDNNFLISHERIRKSQGNDLDFKVINDSLYRQSSLSGLFAGVDNVPNRTFEVSYRDVEKQGSPIVNVKISYVRQTIEDGKPYSVFSVVKDGKAPEEVVMRNMLDLYNTLGNAFSVNSKGEYTKINEKGHSPNVMNEILTLDVLLKKANGQSHDEASQLKSNMKLGFSFVSAIKSSQFNINPLETLKSGGDLIGHPVDQSHLGIQLNASKDTDDKEATLPSQIIGALGLTSYSPEYNKAAFSSLKEIVASSIDERLTAEGVKIEDGSLQRLYDAIRELSVQTMSSTGTAGLAPYILQKANIPLDNPQVRNIVTASINAYLSSEGIRKNIFGNQYVLAPPIQVYENENSIYFGDDKARADRKFSNKLSYGLGVITDSTVKVRPKVFFSEVSFQRDGEELFKLKGKEALKFQLDVKTPYLFKVKDVQALKNALSENNIQYKDKGDVVSLSFETVGDMDKALSLMGEDLEIDYDNQTSRDLKPARVKYVYSTSEGLVVSDLYSTPESIALRKGVKDEKLRNQMLNRLDEKIQKLHKEAVYILTAPGEILAPKSWKSKFLLKDQDALSDMKGDDNYLSFFKKQIQTNAQRRKLADDLWLKEDENGVPLYQALNIIPQDKQAEVYSQVETKRKDIKILQQKIKDAKETIKAETSKLESIKDKTSKAAKDTSRLIKQQETEIRDAEEELKKIAPSIRSIIDPYYATALAENFQEALKSVTTRIPLQSLASVMSQEIVGFLDTEENTAMVNNEHQGLTGGDFDVDKTTYMSRYINPYGLIEKRENKKEYWINRLFEQIYSAAIDHRNMIQRESGVDMESVDEVVKNKGSYEFKENHYLSTLELKNANMVGKDVIGVAATMIKVYSAMNFAANNKLDEFVELYDKLSSQADIDRSIEDINKLNKLFEQLHSEFSYRIGGTTINVDFLSNLPPEKVIKLYQFGITGLIPIENLPDKPEEFVYIPSSFRDFSFSQNESMRKQALDYLANKKLQLQEQHKTADVLGQLLNAATDNAKHLYLSKMNVDVDTAGLLATMIIDGVPLSKSVEFLLDPQLQPVIEQKNSNLFKGTKGLSLRKSISAIYRDYDEIVRELSKENFNVEIVYKELEPKTGLKYDYSQSPEDNKKRLLIRLNELSSQYYDLLKTVDKSSELTALGQILSINQGLNPTSYGMYARINNVNQFYQGKVQFVLNDISRSLSQNKINENQAKERIDQLTSLGLVKLKEGLSPTATTRFKISNYEPVEFDFIRWIEDEPYRKTTTESYEKLKTAHNIFETLQNLPHTLEQLKIFAKSYRIIEATSPKFNAAIEISKQVNKARLLTKPFDEEMFEKYIKAMTMYTQDAYLDNAGPNVHIVNFGSFSFDLGNKRERLPFINAFNSYIMDLKKSQQYSDNQFLNVLVLDESKLNEHGQSIQRLKSIFTRDVISPSSSELATELAIKSDLKKLGPDVIKALRYYNLLIYQDSNAKGSLSGFFTNPELFDEYWDFESTVTTPDLISAFNINPNNNIPVNERTSFYYLTKAGVYDVKEFIQTKEDDVVAHTDADDPYAGQYEENDYYEDSYQSYIDEYQSQAYSGMSREDYIKKMTPSPIKLSVEINGQVKVEHKKSGEVNPTIYVYGAGFISDPNATIEKPKTINKVEIFPNEELTYRSKVLETYDRKARDIINNLLDRVIAIVNC